MRSGFGLFAKRFDVSQDLVALKPPGAETDMAVRLITYIKEFRAKL